MAPDIYLGDLLFSDWRVSEEQSKHRRVGGIIKALTTPSTKHTLLKRDINEMSGGERKKRAVQGTGWEEAGGEFYQECYPGADLDLEALPRDPHYFATLLPSKQNRAATTRRPQRPDNKSTFKRRTSTRSKNYNSMGQNTIQNDIHVAMMPDLSENLANEETTWEEMMLIKTMPITMAQKKEIKAKLLSADTFRLQGLKHFKWKRRKLWEYLKIRRKEFSKKIELWRKNFHQIEGNFGASVTVFFIFVKWLMFLNFSISLLIVIFIFLPSFLIAETDVDLCSSFNETVSEECCTLTYKNTWNNFSFNPFSLIQGDGWVEWTPLYYGVYPNSIVKYVLFNYNLPLAYIATIIGTFLLSLYAIVKRAAPGFKERLIEHEGQYYKYCTMIFSGWDYSIYNENSSRIHHEAIFSEIKTCLTYERRRDERKHISREEKFRLFSVRMFVNSVILLIFIGAGFLVFFIFQFSFNELEKEIDDEFYKLLLEFSPYLCLVCLNLIIPCILRYFVKLESYSTVLSSRLTFVRTILLRFILIGVLLASFYSLIQCTDDSQNSCTSCRTPLCWETYVGRQMYKLLILDFVFNAVIIFFINFPRMLIAKHIKCKLARFIGVQEFDLYKNVLDVVYCQILIWIGSFYAPLLPALGTLIFFMLFYIKKFSCLVNSRPTKTIYHASRSDSMFMVVLLVSYVVAVGPWAYAVYHLEPSRSCGPFRIRSSVWSVMEELFDSLPSWIPYTFHLLTSTSVVLPMFVGLLFSLYYTHTVSGANKHMVEVLKKQLILEGHDKQFLLNRLSAFIKQHQDRHKAHRSVNPPSGSN